MQQLLLWFGFHYQNSLHHWSQSETCAAGHALPITCQHLCYSERKFWHTGFALTGLWHSNISFKKYGPTTFPCKFITLKNWKNQFSFLLNDAVNWWLTHRERSQSRLTKRLASSPFLTSWEQEHDTTIKHSAHAFLTPHTPSSHR